MATTYSTVQGDTWDIISYKLYGDEHYIADLIAANIEHRAVVLFSAGVVLNVPEIKQTEPVSTLPPWKRGTSE